MIPAPLPDRPPVIVKSLKDAIPLASMWNTLVASPPLIDSRPVPGPATVISLLIAWWLKRSRFGASLVAIRENEDAAEALGVNAFACKMGAICIAGAMGGAGGTFYSQKFLYLDPPIAYGIGTSVEMLLVTIVGGMGTIFGPLVGSFVLHGINEVARHYLEAPGLSMIVYGLILVVIVGFLPNGLIGLFSKISRKTKRAKEEKNA